MAKFFYITTPIFYPNDRLHLGHAYTMVVADVIARYKKSKNYEVYFQTGSDEHGEKIEKKAKFLGITPQELVDKNILLFKQLWKELDISEHNFYRTSTVEHKEKVQKIFSKLLEQNDIYLGKYKGNYCVTCEDYISESKVNNSCCSFCNSPLQIIEEVAYFLRVSKYYSKLIEYYEKNPYFISPLSIKKELLENFLKSDVRDLCITRQDLKWGVPVPNNKKLVIYVWFEALCNYINSEVGTRFFFTDNISCEIIQMVGKDIARFHGIYWPIMLWLLKARLPTQLLAHGWILGKGGKMSKSKGNVIDPLELLKKYPKELLRTYFIAKINFLQDGIVEEELLKEFYQDFFVNNLSNLVSRVNKMLHLYNQGIVSEFAGENKDLRLEKYYEICSLSITNFQKMMDQCELTNAFSQIQSLINESNKLIQETTPWELFKKGDISLLNLTLNYLVNGIKIIAFLLSCIIPEVSKKVLTIFNINHKEINWSSLLDFSLVNKIKTNLLQKHLYTKLL